MAGWVLTRELFLPVAEESCRYGYTNGKAGSHPAAGLQSIICCVQPARRTSASAAFSFLLDLLGAVTGIQKILEAFPGHCPGSLLIGGGGVDGLVHAFFGRFQRSVHDAARFSASAAADCFFYLLSAAGTGFSRSAAGGGRPAGDGDPAGPDQAGDAHAGEQVLQILALHDTPL